MKFVIGATGESMAEDGTTECVASKRGYHSWSSSWPSAAVCVYCGQHAKFEYDRSDAKFEYRSDFDAAGELIQPPPFITPENKEDVMSGSTGVDSTPVSTEILAARLRSEPHGLKVNPFYTATQVANMIATFDYPSLGEGTQQLAIAKIVDRLQRAAQDTSWEPNDDEMLVWAAFTYAFNGWKGGGGMTLMLALNRLAEVGYKAPEPEPVPEFGPLPAPRTYLGPLEPGKDYQPAMSTPEPDEPLDSMSGGPKTLECYGCHKSFPTWAALKVHKHTCTPQPSTPVQRSNRFAGTCRLCDGRVEAEAGVLGRLGNGSFYVEHKPGECQQPAVSTPAPPRFTPAPPPQPQPQPAPSASASPAPQVDLTNLPAGRYAAPDDKGRMWFFYVRPTKGGSFYARGSGWAYAKAGDIIVGVYESDSIVSVGFYSKATGTYTGLHADELNIIVRSPHATAKAFARLTEKCYVCNKRLTDPTSMARGIGPDCFAQGKALTR